MEFFTILPNSSCCTPNSGCCELKYPVAIIGAGPIGLAAAAHLKSYNLPFIIFEKNEVAANVASWEHVQLFSSWKYNVDSAAKQILEKNGWKMPNKEEIPTGKALREDYLLPLSELFKEQLHTNEEVIAITKLDTDKMKSSNRANKPFLIFTKNGQATKMYKASAIIDATGTWGNPNPAASHGVMLPSEKAARHKINYQIPNVPANISRYANKRIAVIGGGHSAINSLLQLVELKDAHPQTEITWILRKKRVEDALGGGTADELAARGELGLKMKKILSEKVIYVETPFYIQSIFEKEEGLILKGTDKKIGPFDELIVNTGNRPDFSFISELRYEVDPATEAVTKLAPLINPNLHSCGTVPPHGEKELRQPETNFYIVGSKSYGRAPTFLMATGYEQVRSIVAHLAGDTEAALDVKLSLPETGVCHTGIDGCCQ
ncbi:NAD(P)-binding domain-containing protein [Ureibacillus sp. FSL W8-0352]|uniref:NAD(P)-binding domain-containing protein n=1 Tax=Ureibacillus sp. FSL W8-0352 TaxID=2954596 RepID=UPI0030F4FFE4